jgi:hypothetical protein
MIPRKSQAREHVRRHVNIFTARIFLHSPVIEILVRGSHFSSRQPESRPPETANRRSVRFKRKPTDIEPATSSLGASNSVKIILKKVFAEFWPS